MTTRLPKEEIVRRLDAIQTAVQARMAEAHPDILGLLPSELDWMTAEERAERHELVLQLPSAGEERIAARARLQAKVAARLMS